MRITRQPSPMQIMIDQKQQEILKYFTYLGSLIKMMQDVNVKINPGSPRQKRHSTRRKLFLSEKVFKFQEKPNETPYLEHSCVWCWNFDTSGSRSEVP